MGNKKKEVDIANEKINAWLTFQSIIIIFAAMCSFLVVEIGRIFMEGTDINLKVFTSALGIIIPMCAILGALNYYLFNTTYKYITKLLGSMQKVADGDFSVRLNTKKAGPFSVLYENFNKMSNELEEVQSLKSDFINNYSHEFKTPITSIKGFADLLLEENVSDEEKRQYLKIISEESNRLAHLANTTLLMSKLEHQEIIENKKEYSLDKQIEEVGTILSRESEKKNIKFTAEFVETNYYGNPEIMKQLWINLIANSLKYTPENGSIDLIMKKENNNIIVEIKDSGIGMEKNTIEHIFDKYYQEDKSHSTAGLGLGLSIVKRIVELCDGNIEIESTKNIGTTVKIVLPNEKV